MNRFCWVPVLLLGAVSSTALGQTVLVNEDFESYNTEAELHAVWRGNAGTGAVAGTPAQVEERFVLVDEPGGGISGDFNNDNFVDAADYPVWRKTDGSAAGYDAWTAQFGGPPSPGGPANKFVNHLANNNPPNLPDGNLVYQPLLDPNFVPPNYPGGDGSIFPSQGLEPIVLRGDIFTPSTAIQRNTIGLRYFDGAATTNNLFEMGVYNAVGSQPPNPAGTTGAAVDGLDAQNRAFVGFAVRLQLFGVSGGGVNPDWQQFAFDPLWDTSGNGLVTMFEAFTALGIASTGGWHTLEATFTPDAGGASGDVDITITLDLLRDGLNNAQGVPGVDATITVTNLNVTQAGFNSLRFGGPSQLATTAAMGFDNIVLTGPQVAPGSGNLAAVPEPSAIGLAMMAVGGLFVARRRQRG